MTAEYTYVQRTGWLHDRHGMRMSQGYAGNGEGLNNPDMQFEVRVGPLPVGRYGIGAPYKHPRLGPMTLNLIPYRDNEMRGRAAFRIHGDNAKGDFSASQGCIILRLAIRQQIARERLKVGVVRVVAEESDL
jgi:hypothetical protein